VQPANSSAQPGSAGILPALTCELRLAERFPDDTWQALILTEASLVAGNVIQVAINLMATLIAPDRQIPNMWKIRFNQTGWQLTDLLYRLGQPIRYEYVSQAWSLNDYQTVYANIPGSAEMPSAGRALTWELLVKLQKAGVNVANLVLHTGLSSYMDDSVDAQHIASEEEFLIPQATVDAIQKCRMAGGRVIAVGTTVVRALESATHREAGKMPALPGFAVPQAEHSYTRMRIDKFHELKVVDGLITGLHEPEASHLDLLSAFLDREVLAAAYREAVDLGYLWHEFGDLNLIV
jgi:S-adenosylmethionine:tRNA ribosyltransferase-isomerase